MELKWKNIMAGLMAVVVVVVLVRNPALFQILTVNLSGIGPGHTADEKTLGLITLGLIGILIVGIVRILASHDDRDNKDRH